MQENTEHLSPDIIPNKVGKDFPIPGVGTVTVVYSHHNQELPSTNIPDRFNGIFLETGDGDYTQYPREVLYILRGIGDNTVSEYKSVFPKAQENSAPVFFTDPVIKSDVLAKIDRTLPFLEATLGGTVIWNQKKIPFKEEP